LTLPKLKNNPMERRARRELEKFGNPNEKLRRTAQELLERSKQDELSNDNKNIIKSSN
jgi:hypothetical protein